MERAEAMTGLRSGGQATFPQEFEERVPENAKKVKANPVRVHLLDDIVSHRASRR